ncbi:helicase associated domain-containing protein [Streptomyces sp. NPDC001948]
MRIHYRLAGDDVAQLFALLRKVAEAHQDAVPPARDAYLGEDAINVLVDGDGAGVRVSGAAGGVLLFGEERDPAVPARFVRLRVVDPEGAYWPRGVEAAGRWLRETGNTVLRVPYTVVTPEDWGAVGGYPLGQWIADQRRAYTAGTLEAGRVAELEQLGMVWSEQDAAWADGIAVTKQYAAAHGHFLPPTTATWEGHPIGVWAKNARAAARRAPAETPARTLLTQPCITACHGLTHRQDQMRRDIGRHRPERSSRRCLARGTPAATAAWMPPRACATSSSRDIRDRLMPGPTSLGTPALLTTYFLTQ